MLVNESPSDGQTIPSLLEFLDDPVEAVIKEAEDAFGTHQKGRSGDVVFINNLVPLNAQSNVWQRAFLIAENKPISLMSASLPNPSSDQKRAWAIRAASLVPKRRFSEP